MSENHICRLYKQLRRGLSVSLWAVALLMVNRSPARAATHVGGPILSDATWIRASSPYVVTSDLEVGEGVTLTIEPGVTVQFQRGTGMQVHGTLIVQGMAWGVVTFTSNQDSPAAGDWGNIAFAATAVPTTMDGDGNYVHGSVLQHCVVEYAGDDAESAIDAHSLLIDHCAVRDNSARGIYSVGTAGAPARMTYNTVHRNSIVPRSH